MLLNVQFSDESEVLIIGYYGSPQNPDYYENMGVVETDDSRWATFYYAFPESMRQYIPEPT